MPYRKYNEFHRVENDIEQKQCMDCNNWFDMNSTNFNIVNGHKDGFNHRCKICQEIYQKEYYAKTREHQIEMAMIVYRKNPQKSHQDNLRYIKEGRFRESMKKASFKYRRSKKYEEWKENNVELLKTYNEKRRHKNHKINKKEWGSCKDYFKNEQGEWCCAYCGITEKEHKEKYKQGLHKEHADDKGNNDLSNCIPSCRSCNSSKHTFALEFWYSPDNPNFTQERLDKIKQWLDSDWEQFYIEKKPRAEYGSRKKVI